MLTFSVLTFLSSLPCYKTGSVYIGDNITNVQDFGIECPHSCI